MPKLNIISDIQTYFDTERTSQPMLNMYDWARMISVEVSNPQGNAYTVPANSVFSVFSGIRSTSTANDTEFTLSLSILAPDRYRFTHTAGTAPAFRVSRGLTPNTRSYTWVINMNQTATLTSNTAGDFAAVVAGDTLFVPGPTIGDVVTPFSALNEGYWTVLSKAGTTVLQLSRFSGVDFEGEAEVVVATSNTQLQAFGIVGLQIGDFVNISDGFSSSIQKTYQIVAVNPSWFEVINSDALPVNEVAVPTTSGIVFYTSNKRYLKVEADQECSVRVNGDTGDIQRISPWSAGDRNYTAEYTRTGPTWSLDIVNLSDNPMALKVFSVE